MLHLEPLRFLMRQGRRLFDLFGIPVNGRMLERVNNMHALFLSKLQLVAQMLFRKS